MLQIPKSFKLFGTTIQVVYDNDYCTNKDILGEASRTQSRITLCTSHKGRQLSRCEIETTFYHERLHLMLDLMCEWELTGNEKFVEVLSNLQRQADTMAEYEEINIVN